MPEYVAPFLLSNIPLEDLPEGQFIVPVCTTRERFALITSALWGSNLMNADPSSYAHLVDWLEAIPRIRAGCEFDPADNCSVLALDSERIEWFPESPYAPLSLVPDGYNFHPYTVVDSSLISQIISLFGLGYKIGDVYTDLTKIPIGSSWEDLLTTQYLNFPRFRILDLQGQGTVKLHFLNIPQGGRALISIDGVIYLNPYANRLRELSVDKLSFPPETEVEQIIEVEIEGSGDHFLDVVFLPTVDNDFIPLFFGGGIRAVELCGFDMPLIDPCCPDETNILVKIFNQNNAYMSFVMNMLDDRETPRSFVPDAPEIYDENTGDTDAEARVRALCAAVTRYIYNILSAIVQNYAAEDQIGDILELFPPYGIIIGILDAVVDIAQEAIAGLIGDTDAINDVICQMVDGLSGEANTHAIFKASVDPSAFTPLSNAWQVAVIIDIANASVINWRAFNNILPELYETISGGADVDCPCDCNDDITLVDYLGTGCIITPVGDCIWRFYQPLADDPDVYLFSFRDVDNQCLFVEESPDPTKPTAGVGGDTTSTSCLDVETNYVGGFSGENLKQVDWRQTLQTTYYKITLVV
jgi:hypothetical protein